MSDAPDRYILGIEKPVIPFALAAGVLVGCVLAGIGSLMVAKGCPLVDPFFERDPLAYF